jgi:hypothetical protein
LARDVDPAGVADRHGLDPPGAIHEHADAAVQHMAGVGQLFRQLVRNDVVGRDAAAVESLDAVFVGLRKA